MTACPQSFFFRYVLGVYELDEEVEAHKIESRAIGNAVHETLEKIYSELDEQRKFGPNPHAARTHALLRVSELWTSALTRAAGPSFRRLEGLFELLRERWQVAIETFLAQDLTDLAKAGVERVRLEQRVQATLSVQGVPLNTFGIFDRVIEAEDGVWVDDYKTSGNLGRRLDQGSILRGQQVQLPLYREIAAAALSTSPESVDARLLGVGPAYEQNEPVKLAWREAIRDGFLETTAIALRAARAGQFPLNKDSARCRFCGYRSTCRKSHPPTLDRLTTDGELEEYFLTQEKGSRWTTIDEVLAKRASENIVQ